MLNLEDTLVEHLANGHIVRLGEIGSFQVGISLKSVETPEAIKTNTFSNGILNFRVGKQLRAMLNTLTYKKVKE
jgi:nucleoid DNA-binding protein